MYSNACESRNRVEARRSCSTIGRRISKTTCPIDSLTEVPADLFSSLLIGANEAKHRGNHSFSTNRRSLLLSGHSESGSDTSTSRSGNEMDASNTISPVASMPSLAPLQPNVRAASFRSNGRQISQVTLMQKLRPLQLRGGADRRRTVC